MITDAHRGMTWTTTSVAGRAAHYGVGGSGRPVLFLHGWGLSARTYASALDLLAARGMRVYAPSLPGFGGTEPFGEYVDIAGYARWVVEFLAAAGVDEPVVTIGHSFGGGVAIQLAHDAVGLVSHLIPVNSIGGASWRDGRGVVRPMRERPLWHWGMKLRAEVQPGRSLTKVPRILREAVPNLVRNPAAVWQAATLARCADLGAELAVLRRRRLPVTIAWGGDDALIPSIAFATLRGALGKPPCVRVAGRHGWLIDEPALFADVIADVLAERDTGDSPDVAA